VADAKRKRAYVKGVTLLPDHTAYLVAEYEAIGKM
jgi:hypothetical protein